MQVNPLPNMLSWTIYYGVTGSGRGLATPVPNLRAAGSNPLGDTISSIKLERFIASPIVLIVGTDRMLGQGLS